jgi:Protein of unknown function (DUF3309)
VIAWEAEASGQSAAHLWDVNMTLGTILVILLILLLVGAVPRWGYSRGWGYGPSGLLGIILIIILVLALTGRV